MIPTWKFDFWGADVMPWEAPVEVTVKTEEPRCPVCGAEVLTTIGDSNDQYGLYLQCRKCQQHVRETIKPPAPLWRRWFRRQP